MLDRPYPKINLLSRKEKDYRNLSMTQPGETVKLKSNKIANPNGSGETLRRGDSIKTPQAGSREGAVAIKSQKPFAKINFLSRKTKDVRGMNSINAGGDYQIKSKNKIQSPINPSETLSRGSKVHVGMKTETVLRPGPHTPSTHIEKTIDVPHKQFVPGSFHANKPVDEKTSMISGAVRHENPEKTKMRMEAQKNEQTSYDFKGKKEYSGRHETVYKQAKIKIPVPGKPTVTKETITRPVTTVTKPTKPASQYVPRKQAFENTPWTSTKKQTKAFTSHPNSGGHTKIKWRGSKVKVN